jgi:ABC-type phosphate transport system substrate-binding protein
VLYVLTLMSIARRLTVRAAVLLLAVAALFVSAPVPAHTQGGDIAVVVHPDVPVDNLTVAELRRILLGDREFWTSGVRVALFLRAPVARERDVAVKDVCQMSEAQFRQHWIAKVFRAETPSGPRIVYSGQMAVEQVSRTPGAITFVEHSAVVKGVKVLKIDGRSPGQAGYRVR